MSDTQVWGNNMEEFSGCQSPITPGKLAISAGVNKAAGLWYTLFSLIIHWVFLG